MGQATQGINLHRSPPSPLHLGESLWHGMLFGLSAPVPRYAWCFVIVLSYGWNSIGGETEDVFNVLEFGCCVWIVCQDDLDMCCWYVMLWLIGSRCH